MPIVEPEVLMDGGHDIDTCYHGDRVRAEGNFQELYYQKVALEGMVLKPNMVVPGKKSGKKASAQEVAEKTVKLLKACVPGAVPGIAFLSGGQSDEEATAHLDAMNKIGNLPWKLTFSYGRALQHAVQQTWKGKSGERRRRPARLRASRRDERPRRARQVAEGSGKEGGLIALGGLGIASLSFVAAIGMYLFWPGYLDAAYRYLPNVIAASLGNRRIRSLWCWARAGKGLIWRAEQLRYSIV